MREKTSLLQILGLTTLDISASYPIHASLKSIIKGDATFLENLQGDSIYFACGFGTLCFLAYGTKELIKRYNITKEEQYKSHLNQISTSSNTL